MCAFIQQKKKNQIETFPFFHVEHDTDAFFSRKMLYFTMILSSKSFTIFCIQKRM